MVNTNRLNAERRAHVIAALVEGNSIRSAVRMTDEAKNTVPHLLIEVGAACSEYQNRVMRNLPCETIQLDEIWSFVGCKQKNVTVYANCPVMGDVWTWVALDALHIMWDNFGRKHQTLKTAPAMAAGIADHVWSVSEIVSLLGSN